LAVWLRSSFVWGSKSNNEQLAEDKKLCCVINQSNVKKYHVSPGFLFDL
jgi:hypothetical protein